MRYKCDEKRNIECEKIYAAKELEYGKLYFKIDNDKFLECRDQTVEKINKIYNHYGPIIETEKFFEEIAELLVAVANKDKENIKKEMADVYITCIHMLNKFNILLSEVEKEVEYKVARQERRILREIEGIKNE